MQVQSINSQHDSPNFGIKYVNPRSWDANVLDTLMKSDLVKQIDKKYPDAQVKFCSGWYVFGFYYDLKFKLNETKNSRISGNYDFDLINNIGKTTLEDLERISKYYSKKDYAEEKAKKQQAENVYKAAEESNSKLTDEKSVKILDWFANLFK